MDLITDKNIDMGWNLENSYLDLPSKLYSEIELNPVLSPKLRLINEGLAKELGLDIEGLKSSYGVLQLAGNIAPKGSTPIAQAYAGHQFGHFTMLGDGRALLIGEQISPKGDRFDIQLKGSGRTPYSRGGDGRAALGPMLREYIISEAINGLRIPTTRSLAVVTSGEDIARETYLPGAILTRVSQSHIRVGTFQFISLYGSSDELRDLADYTIKRHFPALINEEYKYLLFLKEVIKRQAELIAKWQAVGFIHGVMNTDNMTISGESIDYGPCAFMDSYDPDTVFSSIDRHGRYAYDNQPTIGVWNLSRFAETLLPLIDEDEVKALEIVNRAIGDYAQIYNEFWKNNMRRKLGMIEEEFEDEYIIIELLGLMKKYKADFTNTFRGLTTGELSDMELFASIEFKEWKEIWENRLDKEKNTKEERMNLMKLNNPWVIPRNHRVEEALEAAEQGDYSLMEKLIEVLCNPYDYSRQETDYTKLPHESKTPYKTFCGT